MSWAVDYGALTFIVQRATLRAFVAAFLHLSIVSRFALMILSSTTIASNCAATIRSAILAGVIDCTAFFGQRIEPLRGRGEIVRYQPQRLGIIRLLGQLGALG
ncbi:hypothetical protein HMP09_p0029 (plasmid) [Sphingomonas sp. HMP9]|uniref:hypothetical protein n=1 Tax=Sphingomonas sp. HMP9 TaxID=1517554 RepID=UPI00159655F9|nr:hypothetical protein [Sphingomonas sp. HMP9]BCA64381.1 hypothetical protein HMP09_p0029 [Sphingomonas sp. HMP9]